MAISLECSSAMHSRLACSGPSRCGSHCMVRHLLCREARKRRVSMRYIVGGFLMVLVAVPGAEARGRVRNLQTSTNIEEMKESAAWSQRLVDLYHGSLLQLNFLVLGVAEPRAFSLVEAVQRVGPDRVERLNGN